MLAESSCASVRRQLPSDRCGIYVRFEEDRSRRLRGGGRMARVVAQETKSVRTRRRILDAAAEVFSEQGYAARLSDIADRAGMKAGSLYYHFDSREDLVAEVLRLGIDGAWDQVASAVGRLPSAATPLQRLEAAIQAHTLSVVGRSAYATAQARIVGSLPPDLGRAHRKDQRAYGEYWRDLFD